MSLQVEKEDPSEEDLEKTITLEMKGTIDEQTRMLHVRHFSKTKQITILCVANRTISKRFHICRDHQRKRRKSRTTNENDNEQHNAIHKNETLYTSVYMVYWLQNTTLSSIKYLKEKMDYSIIDNKFLLLRFYDTSMKYGQLLPVQTFEIYTNSEPVMHTKMVCNRNHNCDMYLYLSIRHILNKLF